MKKTAILLIVLVALVGFAFFYKKATDERTSGYSLSKADAREYLLPGVPSDKIRKIVIQDPKGKVTLAVCGNQWVVEERGGHPAAFQKIEHAVQVLEDVKIKDRKEVGKSALAKLKVLSPADAQSGEGAGLEVQLQDEKGAVLGSVVVGSSPKTSGGASSGNMFGGPSPLRFVRTPNDKDTVWVVDDSFDEFQVDAKGWIDTAWPIITDVKSVEVTFPNAADSWKAERKEKDAPFTFVNAPAGEELDTAKASGLEGRVLEGPPTDVLPKDKVTPDTLKGATKAKMVTFDGFTYDVELLEQKKAGEEGSAPGYLVTFKVSADLPKERKPGPDEKEEDKKRLDEEFKKHGEALTARLAAEQKHQGWVYEVSQYGVSALVKKRSELAREKSEAPAGPEGAIPDSLMPPTAPPAPPGSRPQPHGNMKPLTLPPASLARPLPAPATEPAPPTAPAPSPSPEKPAEVKPAPSDAKPAESKPAEAKPDAAPAEKPVETKPDAPAAEKPAAPAPAPSEKPADAPAPAPALGTEKPAETKPASS